MVLSVCSTAAAVMSDLLGFYSFNSFIQHYQRVLVAGITIWASGFAYFVYKSYHARKPFGRLHKAGMVSTLTIGVMSLTNTSVSCTLSN